MTQNYRKTTGKKEHVPQKPSEVQEQEEFFDLVGKEHVDPRLRPPKNVRELVERIKAKNKAS